MEYTDKHKIIGIEPCGCKVIQHPDTKGMSPFVHYCRLHKSAPDLYEACKDAWAYLAPKCHDPKVKVICDKIGKALAKVEDK